MTEDELSKVADLVYLKLETKFHALDGVVGARGRRGEDGKQGERGLPGRDAKDGAEGKQGTSTRLVIVYKVTETDKTPASPSGGSWDFMTNVVTPPEDGWTIDAPNNDNGYIWQSLAIFDSTGQLIQAWTQPFRLNAKDGGAGQDAYNIEYVYKLTTGTTDIPDVPDNDYDTDDYTGDWEDNPQGITEELKAEWVCSRLRLADGRWGDWIGPSLWSVWGSAGKDGDGVQYVFKRTTENRAPDPITGNIDNENPNEWVPEDLGWTDDPMGVDEENPFEWVSQRKFDGVNKTWSDWSVPKLWASWGKKGDTGLSATFRYQAMVKDAKVPVIENHKADEPGDQWLKLIPELEPGKVLWACLALVDDEGHVYCDPELPEAKQGWQGPWKISGADGERGKRGFEPDYVKLVFKQSEYPPTKPTGTDPNSPGDSWQPTIPSGAVLDKNWWGCWGQVTHAPNPEYNEKEDTETEEQVTNVTWGNPLPINGYYGNPCILAAILATIPQGNNGKWIILEHSYATGVLEIKIDNTDKYLGKATLTSSAGYTIDITSAILNWGDVQSANGTRIKLPNQEHKCSGTSFMYAPHVYIENGTIYMRGFALRNKGNDSLWATNWDGSNGNSFTLVVFGTVKLNSQS